MALTREDWIVIGISGVTCGGKTSLANRLKARLAPLHVFHQDRYFLPDEHPRHVPCEGLAQPHHNYDVLSALDMAAMARDVAATLRGEDRAHWAGSDPAARLAVPGKHFLLLEGFTVLNYQPLLDLCDLRYYLVLEWEECVRRRCLRLYDPPDVPGYFDRCVWPEHLKYRAEIEKDPRVTILDGTQPDVLDLVLADVELLARS